MVPKNNQRFFILIVFCVPLLATNLISYFVFGHIPHIQDSIAQLFQAKIFAAGKIYAIPHPLKEFFDYTHIINSERWYSQYPPGHPFFLLLGILLGMPWFVNPLCGALSVVVVYLLGREIYNDRIGQWGAVFMILSPFFLFMSSEFMSHSSIMLTFALFALFFFKALKSKKFYYAIAAGAFYGLSLTIRPYSALGLILPFFIYGLLLVFKRPKDYALLFVLTVLAALPFVIILLRYNYITSGHPLRFGYAVLYGSSHGLGFGKGTWGAPHTLIRGLGDFWDSVKSLNLHLFGWPLSSLIPILLLFISGSVLQSDWLLFLTFFSLGFVHIFYWYHDLCFGPRFIYESLPFLVLISVRGIHLLPDFIHNRLKLKSLARTRIDNFVKIVIAILFAYNVFITIPNLVRGDSSYYWRDREYANSYWGVDPYLSRLVKSKNLKKSIVFVAFDYEPFPFDSLIWYGSGFLNNSPDLKDEVIYARHLGPRDSLLMNHYPQRKYYFYHGRLRFGGLVEINRATLQ